ncbi:site-specific integrase [Arenimonas sp. SCN 70-307]|uniref:site-specific integrase n=1 Tax=Arenimonas sp. SCN 70-307 TaxID=1660089 RepID=UPI000A5842E8|nr:site-specific integrase [Arenimonas sp. SCN 70-307]
MTRRSGKTSGASDYVDYGIPTLLETRDGLSVKTSSERWLLGLNTSINWERFEPIPQRIVLPVKAYLCHCLQIGSPRSAGNDFARLLAGFSRIERDALRSLAAGELGMSLFHAFKAALENDESVTSDSCKDCLQSFRRWYVWCADVELPNFLDSVALTLEQRTIGGSAKGQAVLSNDPHEGPISFVEDVRVETAIARDFDHLDRMQTADLQSLVAVLLSKSFGLYGAHLQLINEADYQVEVLPDGRAVHWLHVPRLKKRGVRAVVGSRRRRLSDRLAASINLLKQRNAADCGRSSHIQSLGGEVPLFLTRKPRERFIGTTLEVDAYRWRLAYFVDSMSRFAKRHGLNFRLAPRRLRYTFATRLVDEGCSPLELADALDHTDLQHVMVYFNSRGGVVRQLDAAMALRLAPLANAFLGRIVPRPPFSAGSDAVSSVIKFRGGSSDLRDVGHCSISTCGLDAPLACYTCPKFEPWVDGPHGFVLDELVKDRKRKVELGFDGRIVQVHDRTILAVADVVRKTAGAGYQDEG